MSISLAKCTARMEVLNEHLEDWLFEQVASWYTPSVCEEGFEYLYMHVSKIESFSCFCTGCLSEDLTCSEKDFFISLETNLNP